jgi:hypothetical protein
VIKWAEATRTPERFAMSGVRLALMVGHFVGVGRSRLPVADTCWQTLGIRRIPNSIVFILIAGQERG